MDLLPDADIPGAYPETPADGSSEAHQLHKAPKEEHSGSSYTHSGVGSKASDLPKPPIGLQAENKDGDRLERSGLESLIPLQDPTSNKEPVTTTSNTDDFAGPPQPPRPSDNDQSKYVLPEPSSLPRAAGGRGGGDGGGVYNTVTGHGSGEDDHSRRSLDAPKERDVDSVAVSVIETPLSEFPSGGVYNTVTGHGSNETTRHRREEPATDTHGSRGIAGANVSSSSGPTTQTPSSSKNDVLPELAATPVPAAFGAQGQFPQASTTKTQPTPHNQESFRQHDSHNQDFVRQHDSHNQGSLSRHNHGDRKTEEKNESSTVGGMLSSVLPGQGNQRPDEKHERSAKGKSEGSSVGGMLSNVLGRHGSQKPEEKHDGSRDGKTEGSSAGGMLSSVMPGHSNHNPEEKHDRANEGKTEGHSMGGVLSSVMGVFKSGNSGRNDESGNDTDHHHNKLTKEPPAGRGLGHDNGGKAHGLSDETTHHHHNKLTKEPPSRKGVAEVHPATLGSQQGDRDTTKPKHLGATDIHPYVDNHAKSTKDTTGVTNAVPAAVYQTHDHASTGKGTEQHDETSASGNSRSPAMLAAAAAGTGLGAGIGSSEFSREQDRATNPHEGTTSRSHPVAPAKTESVAHPHSFFEGARMNHPTSERAHGLPATSKGNVSGSSSTQTRGFESNPSHTEPSPDVPLRNSSARTTDSAKPVAASAALSTAAAQKAFHDAAESTTKSNRGDGYNHLSDGTPSGINVGSNDSARTPRGQDIAKPSHAAAADTTRSTNRDGYNHLADGTLSGIDSGSGDFTGSSRNQNAAKPSHAAAASTTRPTKQEEFNHPKSMLLDSDEPVGSSREQPRTSTGSHGLAGSAASRKPTKDDGYNHLVDGTASGINTGSDDLDGTHREHRSAGNVSHEAPREHRSAGNAPTSHGISASSTKPKYDDGYNHLTDGTPSGIMIDSNNAAGVSAGHANLGNASHGSSTSSNKPQYDDEYNHLDDGTPSGIKIKPRD